MENRREYRPSKRGKARRPGAARQDAPRRPSRYLIAAAACTAVVALAAFLASGSKTGPASTEPGSPERSGGAAGMSRSEQDSGRPDASRQRPAPADYAGVRAEALETATALLQRFPKAAESYGLLAWLHQRFGDSDGAADCWMQCIERIPQFPEAYYRLGRYAKEKGEDEKALPYLTKAFALAPTLPGIHAQLGETLMSLGRMEEAVAVLEADLDMDSASPFRLLALGHAYLQAQQYEKAKLCFTKTVAKSPDLTHAYYGLATACARLGQTEEAKKHLESFRAHKSRDVAADRADLKNDDMDRLQVLLATTHSMAGMVYSRSGDLNQAEQHWLRAAFLDPNEIQARKALLQCYRMRGDTAGAAKLSTELTTITAGQGN